MLLHLVSVSGEVPATSQDVPAAEQRSDDPANTVAANPAPSQEALSGDIVVTARRRSERVQDVPIALSVLDEETLQRTGTWNVNRLVQLLPSVQFYTSNPRNSAINIRGLGAPFGLTNDGIEQGVGLYIDQVYYSRPAAASFDFVDVERIEVLRGPQGTLYGKNTTAGALNITSRAPSFTPEGRVEMSAGNLGFFQAKLSVSGPIVADRVAARLAVTGTRRRGTLYNVATGNYVNELDNTGLRGAVLWQAAPDLKLTFSTDYNHQNPECCTQTFVRVAPTLRNPNRQFEGLAAASGYAPPSRDPYDRLVDNDADLEARQDFGGASLLAEWDAGAGTLTSVTAWRYWDWFPASDRDYIGLPITTISANPSKQRQVTQEVRFSSAGKRRFDYTVGAFAYRQTIHSTGLQEQGSAASLWLLGPNAVNLPALLDGYRQTTAIDFENNSVALFGRVTWNISGRLRVQPGIRFNWDSKAADYDAQVSGGIANPTPAQAAIQRGVLAPQAYHASFSKFNVSGDINLSWDVSRDAMAYATYARSFKSGGVNLSGLPNDAGGNPALALATVAPEKVDHFELGLKSQWFDRRLTFNLAVYRTDIHDYQATVVNGQAGVLRGYLANADQVRVQGVEVDVQARPAPWLSLYASTAYTDGKYVSFPDAPPPIELAGGPQVVDISGAQLPGISKWATSWGGQAERRLSDGWTGYFGADASYRSSFSSSATPSPWVRVDGYTIANFRLGARSDGGWDAFAWVRNAFDAEYLDFATVQPGNTGLIVGQPGDPRTYGITIARRF
ncbi:MAG: TonB-dependent receptor [Pseudomonadota bacterium]